jgi:hypothetical protein
MEDRFYLNATSETPEVVFDRAKNEFKISGKSMPENALDFYAPILNWLEHYKATPNNQTQFDITLDYFNSGSVKQVFKILCILEEITEQGKTVDVFWHYKKGDELMLMKGLEFDKFLDLTVEVKER